MVVGHTVTRYSDNTIVSIHNAALTIFETYLPSMLRCGAAVRARCPFHDDRTPSLSIRAGRFRCFGCGAGGDVLDFVQKVEGCDFREAVQIAAGLAGIAVEQTTDHQEFSEAARKRGALAEFRAWKESAMMRAAVELRDRDMFIRQIDNCRAAGLLSEDEALDMLVFQYAGYSELEQLFATLRTGTAEEARHCYSKERNGK